MKIAVIGSGGREHALAWRMNQEGHEVGMYPGRPGVPWSTGIPWQDVDALTTRFLADGIELVIIGPEAPLAAGHADVYRARGLTVLGAGAAGARLESSKAYAKDFMRRHGVRTARAEVVQGLDALRACLAAWEGGVVLKYDGLAEGKGVWVCSAPNEREEAVAEIGARFGDRATVVVEQLLRGREVSCIGLTDGMHLVMLPPSQDHKRLLDGDTGPNTGGMGAYAPAQWLGGFDRGVIWREIVQPTLDGLRHDSLFFTGVIYFGLMICADGPYLLEYNMRFGDPEAQALMLAVAGDLGTLFRSVAHGDMRRSYWMDSDAHAVCVVLASQDYPGKNLCPAAMPNGVSLRESPIRTFVAGAEHGAEGWWATGGRVMGITASGRTPALAREAVYEAVPSLAFVGAQWRTDIARHSERTRIAVLYSGAGSNFAAVCLAAREGMVRRLCKVVCAVGNVSGAGGDNVALAAGVPFETIANKGLTRADHEARLLAHLQQQAVQVVVLAGYMRVLSLEFVARYPGRILNIHPADTRLHQGTDGYEWAWNTRRAFTTITVHKVDAGLDTGEIILQREVDLRGATSLDEVKARGLAVEHELYPLALRKFLLEEM